MNTINDGEPVESEERAVIQRTINEVRRTNVWATRIEIALVALMVISVMVSVGITTHNSTQLRRLLGVQIALQEHANDQRAAITSLAEVIQKYNEDHAKQAEISFRTLHEAQRCAILKLFTGAAFEQVTPEEIAACYQPVVPAPTPPPPVTTTTTTRRER